MNQNQNTTKESFLHYFFGQNQGQAGPNSGAASTATVAGHTLSSSALTASTSTMERVEEPDDGMHSGLLAPKRDIDGKTAAFDMRSLDKHIEAVGIRFLTIDNI